MGEAKVRKLNNYPFKGNGYKKLQGRLGAWTYNVAIMGIGQMFKMRTTVTKYFFNEAGELHRLYPKAKKV